MSNKDLIRMCKWTEEVEKHQHYHSLEGEQKFSMGQIYCILRVIQQEAKKGNYLPVVKNNNVCGYIDLTKSKNEVSKHKIKINE
jgi:hypothetical protein